jgi:hypothetical protein
MGLEIPAAAAIIVLALWALPVILSVGLLVTIVFTLRHTLNNRLPDRPLTRWHAAELWGAVLAIFIVVAWLVWSMGDMLQRLGLGFASSAYLVSLPILGVLLLMPHAD